MTILKLVPWHKTCMGGESRLSKDGLILEINIPSRCLENIGMFPVLLFVCSHVCVCRYLCVP